MTIPPDTIEAVKLLPCPFCGGEADMDMVGTKAKDGGEPALVVDCENLSCHLGQFQRGGRLLYSDHIQAAVAWNTRASTPAAPDVESLRAALTVLADYVSTTPMGYRSFIDEARIMKFMHDNAAIIESCRQFGKEAS